MLGSAPMLLGELLKNQFNSAIQNRGAGYFQHKRVTFKGIFANEVQFAVEGSEEFPYEVSIRFNSRDFEVSCECAAFIEYGQCKHLWASVLESDRLKIKPNPGGGFSAPEPEVSQKISWRQKIDKAKKNTFENTSRRSTYAVANRNASPKIGYYVINIESSENRQEIYLQLMVQDRLKKGGLGELKEADLERAKIEHYEDPLEKEFLWDLLGKTEVVDHHYNYNYNSSRRVNSVTIMPGHADLLLKKISDAGKLYIATKNRYARHNLSVTDFTKITYDQRVWSFNLKLIALENGYEMQGELLNEEGATRSLKNILGTADSFVFFNDAVVRSDYSEHKIWGELLKSQTFFIETSERDSFLNYFFGEYGSSTPITLPPEIQFTEKADLVPTTRLLIETDKNSGRLAVRLGFLYEMYLVFLNTGHFIYDADKKEKIIRNLNFETEAMQKLLQLRPYPSESTNIDGFFNTQQLVSVVEKALEFGWEVLAENKKVYMSGEIKIDFVSGIDWFDVDLDLGFANKFINFPQLLQAVKSGQRMISLGDGSTGLLPEAWLNKIKPILEMGEITAKGVRLNKLQALFLSASLDENVNLTGDKKFKTLKNLLEEIKTLVPEETDKKLKASLRTYQKTGLAWLNLISENELGGILADDMGLGKTLQTIAMLSKSKSQNTASQTSLVLAPKSLLFNWQSEVEKFAPHLSVFIYIGTQRKDFWAKYRNYDLIITTYQTMRNDIETFKEINFEFLILDEAHYVKNAQSQMALAARLIQAKKKIALTGTPVENSLMDLFSILMIVAPGLINPSLAQRWVKEQNSENIKRLGKALSPFLLRRTKDEVLKDLPEKSEQVLYVELSAEERTRYDALKVHYWSNLNGKIKEKGLAKSKIEVLEALLRLRQAACHQGLLDTMFAGQLSSKFELTLEQLENVIRDGHKALVFSQFTSLLALFAQQLKSRDIKFEYLDGQTTDRAQRVDKFQNDKSISIFLLSLKAGGVGLNLTAADYVFILDPWWNPAAETQAIDRTHRIGQTKKVFAYKIIAKDTVEEKILNLQNRKKEIANAIVSENSSLLKSVQLSDLQELFS